MHTFDPQPGAQITIGEVPYEFISHYLLPEDTPSIYIIEGQEGFIWPLHNLNDRTFWALKVLKPGYRDGRIARVTSVLRGYVNVSGFFLSQRICLTRPEYAHLIATFPDLEYAILMPWLPWKTWAGLIRSPEASATYTSQQALDLALATAQALYGLEQRGCAHTDIAGSNTMYRQDFKQIELLDLEGLYAPGLPEPKQRSYGSPGYQHHRPGKHGQYTPYGDRFAGAILLTEMLTWWNPLIRGLTPPSASTLFQPEELQLSTGPRWQMVRDLLWSLDKAGALLDLFDAAWHAPNPQQCPDFLRWVATLQRLALANASNTSTPFSPSSPYLRSRYTEQDA
jgi:serine/threonine protein kinase